MIIIKYSNMIRHSEQIQYETMVFGCFFSSWGMGSTDKREDIENFPSTMGFNQERLADTLECEVFMWNRGILGYHPGRKWV